jgi:gliding motility-associatede transport system auxiliary component
MKFSKKQFYKASSTVQILIVLAILIVVNVLSVFINIRFDMTEGKDFSISKTTKNIVKELDDIVVINAYFTKDLPGRLIPLKQQVEDILDEYVNYSQGKINISFIDPAASDELKLEVQSLGIPPVQFSTVEQDKYEVANGYLGLAILYEDGKEIIPVVESIATLEYELTNAIKKVTSDESLTVAFSTGHDELAKDVDFQTVTKYLEKQYSVVEQDLSTGELIDESIKTLIIAQPKLAFTDRDLYIIDQFLMRGGSVLALVDGTSLAEGLQASKLNTGLENLLAKHGIMVNPDLVLDVSNGMASFTSGYVQFMAPYPFFVKSIGQFMNPDSVLVNRLESVLLPWVSSVELMEEGDDTTSVFDLIRTTDSAWNQVDNFNLDPQQQFSIPNESRMQYSLAAAKFGSFESYFNNKDIPGATGEQSEDFISSTEDSRLIVVGDGDFATDSFLRQNSENLIFLSNLVDGLTQDLDLIMIRSKSITDRPLKDVSFVLRQVIKYINILLPTIIMVIYGFVRMYIRRKESRRDVI